MIQDPDIQCYAVRRVNPFLGVLQVIDTPDGRATTTNGLTWDIQVTADMPDEWGSLSQLTKQKAYYRYGLWSEDTGLVHRPLAIQSEHSELSQQSFRIIGHIQANLTKLPFSAEDYKELWLLDAEQKKPLALLATTTADTKPPSPEPRYWNSCLGQNGVASQLRFPESDLLNAQVKRRAGFNYQKRWYIRDPQNKYFTNDNGAILPTEEFPPCLLSEHWHDKGEQKRARDYIHWIAPALLTLPNLSEKLRERLECNLNHQAVSIEYHWRLFPKVLDQQKLNSCRVQAQLQSSVKINKKNIENKSIG